MKTILDLPLSINTLLFFMLIPFLYFGYQTAYWYNRDKLRNLDFLFRLLVVGLSILVMSKLFSASSQWSWTEMQIIFMHLAPLLLSLLIASNTMDKRIERAVDKAQGRGEEKKKAPTPKAENLSIEKLGWDDVVINEGLKEELLSVTELLQDSKVAKQYGIEIPKGILLYGPPGNGKTTVAKVIANTAGLAFFPLRTDEIVSKWVGESEKNLTALFNAAKKAAPSVIFIDEVDSIGKSRSGTQAWADNLLNHMLQLIDGVVKTEGIYVIAATNRPDLVDDALKRPGRLSKMIEVPLPDIGSRTKLFTLFLSKLQLAETLDIDALAEITEGMSGAELQHICNQAGLNSFKRESQSKGKRQYVVTFDDFDLALREHLLGAR
ncbi:MAG: ATP-binding protein [Bdellovibrionales bacterium]|nr:ATP-binding protein [Bdellovibrionales bacterium]